jgi:CO/xanthine dehydrogenase Mo-binding subunit
MTAAITMQDCKKHLDAVDYPALRREQAEKRAKGELMGIGLSTFTEVVGAGPSKDFDILGIKMFDSAEIRVHPTGKAIARFGTKSQGQGHETTYAQIIAEELGIPAENIQRLKKAIPIQHPMDWEPMQAAVRLRPVLLQLWPPANCAIKRVKLQPISSK